MKYIKTFDRYVNEMKSFDQFLNEAKSGKSDYQRITKEYIRIVTSRGVRQEDGLYDCHEWVGAVDDIPGIKVYLTDEDKIDNFYDKVDYLNKKFKSILRKTQNNGYFGYISGHSFIKVDGIFIDLTMDSEGSNFKDTQSICKELSTIDMFY